MAAASPRSPAIDWTWNVRTPSHGSTGGSSPPLELQLLPPAPLTSSESPWGVDPSRLQQLMMGSATSSSSAAPTATTSVPSSTPRDLGALFDDHGVNKPLPSGWERCLDLQSGEVFVKKCEPPTRGLQTLIHTHPEQEGKDWKQNGAGTGRELEASSQTDEQRQDWSRRWLQGETTVTFQNEAANSRKSSLSVVTRHGGDEDTSSLPDREPLCLDLSLTNGKRSRISIGVQDPAFLRASNGIANELVSTGRFVRDLGQQRTWQQCANSSEATANVQEMARESTMVTAVCSKCLMYVLLRKSSPVCPRCSVPIVLDGVLATSVNKKRPLFELSPDDLSLSTDSSR